MFEVEKFDLFELPIEAQQQFFGKSPIAGWVEDQNNYIGFLYTDPVENMISIYRVRVPILVSYTNMVSNKIHNSAMTTALGYFANNPDLFEEALPSKIVDDMIEFVQLLMYETESVELIKGYEIAFIFPTWYRIFTDIIYPELKNEGVFPDDQWPDSFFIIEDDQSLIAVFDFKDQENLMTQNSLGMSNPEFENKLGVELGYLILGTSYENYNSMLMKWLTRKNGEVGLVMILTKLSWEDASSEQDAAQEDADVSLWLSNLEDDDSDIDWNELFRND